jgi:hypothetical protein
VGKKRKARMQESKGHTDRYMYSRTSVCMKKGTKEKEEMSPPGNRRSGRKHKQKEK